MFIPYAKHVVTEEQIKAVEEVMREGWLGLGKRGAELESKLAPWFGRKDGVLVNSGSSANFLAIQSMMSPNAGQCRLKKGDFVVVPICGFPTTVNPIIQAGLVPIFIGVDIGTYNLNVDDLMKTVSYRPKAIMFAHALGNPANMNAICDFCDKTGAIMIEDCCDAISAKYDGKFVGSFGRVATLSMYSAHQLPMGEGGFVTGTEQIVKIVRSMRDWGRDCTCYGKGSQQKDGMCGERFSDWLNLGIRVDHKYVYGEIGYHMAPTEMQAAIGLCEEANFEDNIEARNKNFDELYNIFSEYKNLFYLPVVESEADPAWFVFPVTLKDIGATKREHIVQYFEENGIQTRPYFAGNILRHPAYKNLDIYGVCANMEVADYITKNTFFIGVHQHIGEKELEHIRLTLRKYIESELF